jgi:glycosyltransferase involved in cell wall biosynthesis
VGISVIIPVKNRAILLKRTLENILNQRLQPTEIIVVDDHSSDNLAEVVELFKESIIFIKSQGIGPGAARNTGYLASTGDYIQFFDSDDLMTYDKLEIQYNQLQSSSSGMAYCPHVKAIELEIGTWEQTDSILYYKPLSKRLRYDQWVLRGACMITQSCLFKRSLIAEAGLWRTDLMPHEDLEFLFRIGRSEPYPIHSNLPAVIYRQHPSQITDQSTTQQTKAIDQLNAYGLIVQQLNNESNAYSYFDTKVIENNLIRASKYVDPVHWSADYNKLNSILNETVFFFNKISNKLQRIATQSNWQFLHGVNNDAKQFDYYIDKLDQQK